MKNYPTSVSQTLTRFVLGLFMLFAGISHLTFMRSEFQAQVPQWLQKTAAMSDAVVLVSGVVEIIFGLALLFLGRYKAYVGIALALFYIIIFPGNISQYINGVDAFGLDTNLKRLIRLFFQPILVILALWSTKGYNLLKKQNKYWK